MEKPSWYLKTQHLVPAGAFRSSSEECELLGSHKKKNKQHSLAPLTSEEVTRQFQTHRQSEFAELHLG